MDNNVNNMQNGQMGGGMQNGNVQGNFQPQAQMMQPMKPPMDPAKKKKLILGIVLGVSAVVIAIVALVVVSMLMQVDYGESYRVAKELKPKVSDINSNYDCSRVIQYASESYTSDTTYDGYIDGCLALADGTDELVEKLGETSGVKNDKDVKAQYERFQEAITAVLPDEDELGQRLKIYKNWHKFMVAANFNAGSVSDAQIQSAAKILTESGNEILAEYGAGWLEKTLAYVQAYRAYNNTSLFDSNYNNLRTTRYEKETEWKNWRAENRPDINEVGGLSFENASKMYTEFTKLYEMITERYEKNYDDSGDCTEFLGEVICS